MLVFAYFTMALINIYRAPNSQRESNYSPNVWGTTN